MKEPYNGNLARYIGHFNTQNMFKAVFMSTYNPLTLNVCLHVSLCTCEDPAW